MWSRISVTCMPLGVDSLSTDTTSRNRVIARGMIMAAMSSDATLRTLMRTFEPLHTDRSPLLSVPTLDARGVQWLRPELVGEVEFGEFTPGGILRHSRWRGLRPDKSPADVVRES